MFKEEVLRKRYEEETGSLAAERAKQEAEEHRSLMAWNDAENLRLRKIRWDIQITDIQIPLMQKRNERNNRAKGKWFPAFLITLILYFVPNSELRVQQETEAAEQKNQEAAILHQQERENYIKEKEREIMRLQVRSVYKQ